MGTVGPDAAVQVIFRLCYQAGGYRVMVNVINLLCGKGRAEAFFGTVILSPKLIAFVSAIGFTGLLKEAKHPSFPDFAFIRLNSCNDLP